MTKGMNLDITKHLITGKNPRGWGYAVFGEVVEGMDVVDAISAVRTGGAMLGGAPSSDVPRERVIIKQVRRVEAP